MTKYDGLKLVIIFFMIIEWGLEGKIVKNFLNLSLNRVKKKLLFQDFKKVIQNL